MNDTSKRIDTALRQAVRQRNYRRQRDRALRRLGNLYPDQYRELFEEERARDEEAHKVWVDISGRTNVSAGTSTFHQESGEVTGGLSYQSHTRNDEGEE
jgi:hypothetical protein